MAYQDNETGATTSRPIELYEFVGTYNSYYYTSYSENIEFGGDTYLSIAIGRNKLKVGTQEQPENALEITLPFDNPMVTAYAYQNAPPSLQLTLHRVQEGHLTDSVTLWSGRVTGFSVAGRTASLKIPTLFSYILEGNTPTPRYQAPCNHVLYSPQCGVDPAAFQQTTTVTEVLGATITVSSLPWSDGEAVAGVIFTAAGEQRMIMANSGNDIDVSYSFSTLNVGDSVTIRKGCDHAFNGDCKNKFSNGARFGGFPIVPPVNPFTSTLS